MLPRLHIHEKRTRTWSVSLNFLSVSLHQPNLSVSQSTQSCWIPFCHAHLLLLFCLFFFSSLVHFPLFFPSLILEFIHSQSITKIQCLVGSISRTLKEQVTSGFAQLLWEEGKELKRYQKKDNRWKFNNHLFCDTLFGGEKATLET